MDPLVINLMNALAAQIVAAVHLFVRQATVSVLSANLRGQLICMVDVLVEGSIPQHMPPAVQTVRGGPYVFCQLCPCAKQLAPLSAQFFTLWVELDNGRPARLMEGVILLSSCFCYYSYLV